jgi:hypothetical protein
MLWSILKIAVKVRKRLWNQECCALNILKINNLLEENDKLEQEISESRRTSSRASSAGAPRASKKAAKTIRSMVKASYDKGIADATVTSTRVPRVSAQLS